MKKNKEKNAYATLSVEKITAKNKPEARPQGKRIVGGDLRTRQGK